MEKIIMSICLIPMIVYAQEKSEGTVGVNKSSEAQVEISTGTMLETEWEYQFNEPVSDVIFEEAEMTVKEAKALGWKDLKNRKDNEKVNMSKIKAVVSRDKITFSDGKIISLNKSKSEQFIFSKNKKYILVSPWPNEDVEPDGGRLYESSGRLVWEKKDTYTPVALSDEGNVIAGALSSEVETAPKEFVFYNLKGEETGKIKNKYENVYYGYALFSEKGDFAITAFVGEDTNLILSDKTGKVIWEKKVEGRILVNSEYMQILDQLGIIGIESESEKIFAYLRNMNWDVVWRVQVKFGNYIELSNNKIYVMSINGYVCAMDMINGKIIWEYEEDWANIIKSGKEKIQDKNMRLDYLKSPNRYDLKIFPYFYQMIVKDENLIIIGRNQSSNNRNQWSGSVVYLLDLNEGKVLKKINYENKKFFLLKVGNKSFILDENKQIQKL